MHTQTQTLLFWLKGLPCNKNWKELKLKNEKFKAQVVERSSSSTSVNNQLIELKEEIQNIRISFIPKLNSIQTSTLNDASDIASLTDSQSLISDHVLQLALLSGQVDLLQGKVIASDNFAKQHFQKVEGGIEHLNTWMMHPYNMIKREHLPT